MSKPEVNTAKKKKKSSNWLVFLLVSLFFIIWLWPMHESRKLEIYHDAYKEAEYNNKIEEHGKRIQELNTWLVPKIDTILKYKKATHTSGVGKTSRSVLKERRKAVIFYDHVKNHVPPELLGELMSYWDSIGEDLLKVISINKDRSLGPENKNVPSIRYTINSEYQSHKEPFYKERHFILYNDSLKTVPKIPNRFSDLVKEVYVERLDSLKYYIEIRPYTGF